MIDLSTVEKRWEVRPDPDDGSPRVYRVSTSDADDVVVLVAELRAARKVVRAATIYHATRTPALRAEAFVVLGDALAAYNEVVR